jgi:putative membrane protein
MTDLPYCGAPATPLDLTNRWMLEPGLLGALALCAAAFAVVALRTGPARRGALGAGWLTLVIAFVSPLCALSMALFAARVGQHLLLTLLAAPLLAYGLGLARLRLSPLPWAAGFAALFWLWHAPGPYAATLDGDALYWTMHLSLLGAAIGLWAALMGARGPAMGAAAAATLGTGAQMSVLAALLLWSREPWHVWHVGAAAPWGLTGLEDQQLAAALMWVVGATAMAVAAAFVAAGWWRRIDAGAPA